MTLRLTGSPGKLGSLGFRLCFTCGSRGLKETAGDIRSFFELMPHLWVPQSAPCHPSCVGRCFTGTRDPDGPLRALLDLESETWARHHHNLPETLPLNDKQEGPGPVARCHMIKEPTQSLTCSSSSRNTFWVFPGVQLVRTLPSSAGGAGLILGQRAKIPHASGPKNQNIEEILQQI